MSASRHAILLLGRGGLGSAAKNELQALREQCQQQAGAAPVALAFVDRAQPALPEALDALLAAQPQGLERITIQPVFVPDEPALRRWLEKLAMRWLAQHPPPSARAWYLPIPWAAPPSWPSCCWHKYKQPPLCLMLRNPRPAKTGKPIRSPGATYPNTAAMCSGAPARVAPPKARWPCGRCCKNPCKPTRC